MEFKNCWRMYPDADLQSLEEMAAAYREFLSNCKTERECTAYVKAWAKENGFVDLSERVKNIEETKFLKVDDKLKMINI